jgi:hypothetical protein
MHIRRTLLIGGALAPTPVRWRAFLRTVGLLGGWGKLVGPVGTTNGFGWS